MVSGHKLVGGLMLAPVRIRRVGQENFMKTTAGPPENNRMVIDNVKISEFRAYRTQFWQRFSVYLFKISFLGRCRAG